MRITKAGRFGIDVPEHYVDPFICYKDSASSGPSPTDPGLAGLAGGGSYEPVAAAAGAVSPDSGVAANNLFNVSVPFSADSGSAIPGVGGTDVFGNPSNVLASLGTPNPGGDTAFGGQPAQPFNTYGNIGQILPSITGGSYTGGTGINAQGPTLMPSITGGAYTGTGGVGAAAVAPPSGAGTASPDPTAAAGGTSGFSLENLIGGIGKTIAQNPLGLALAAGGLGYNLTQSQKQSPYAEQLASQASQLGEEGKKLASYLQSGTLPPGLKDSLDQATKAAKAKVVSNFAAQGLPTDPAKNSALASELAAIDQQAIISTAQIGQQLLSSGQTASGLSSDLYKTLASIDQTQTNQISQAIANFAAAMSPTRSISVKV